MNLIFVLLLISITTLSCSTARSIQLDGGMPEYVTCGHKQYKAPILCVDAKPNVRAVPGNVHLYAEILEGTKPSSKISWCPTAVSWAYGDGGGNSYTVNCKDRGPWSEDREYGYGIYNAIFSVMSGNIVVTSYDVKVTVTP